MQLLSDVLGRWPGEAKKRKVSILLHPLRIHFKIFLSLFKSLPFRCVSVGPPVYSWGRIWPIGGNFSISYFKSSIQISVINLLSFDIILFLCGTGYGPPLYSRIYIYPTSYFLVSYTLYLDVKIFIFN